MYLAVPGLICNTRDLGSSLQYAGFLVAAYELSAASCGISFPEQGWKRRPPALGAQTLSPWTTMEVSN